MPSSDYFWASNDRIFKRGGFFADTRPLDEKVVTNNFDDLARVMNDVYEMAYKHGRDAACKSRDGEQADAATEPMHHRKSA